MADQKSTTLTLRSLAEQPQVSINGATYPFKSRLMRDLLEIIKLDQLNAKIDAAFQAVGPDGPTAADVTAIRALLDEFCRMVIEAPDAFFADLDDLDRLDIRNFFIALQRPSQPAAEPQTTGSTPPAGSPGSTPVPAAHGIG